MGMILLHSSHTLQPDRQTRATLHRELPLKRTILSLEPVHTALGWAACCLSNLVRVLLTQPDRLAQYLSVVVEIVGAIGDVTVHGE